MKKSLSRILTLVLVLAMVISAVPFAFAEGEEEQSKPSTAPSVSVEAIVTASTTTAKLDDTVTLTRTYEFKNDQNTPVTVTKVSWTGSDSYTITEADADRGYVELTGSVRVDYSYEVEVEDEDGNTTKSTETDYKEDDYSVKIDVESDAAEITVTVSPESETVAVGATVSLSADVDAEDGVDYGAISWSSNNSTVATVDQNGTVTGVKAGTATITATVTVDRKQYSGSASITVEEITINCANTDVEKGEYVYLTPTLSGSDEKATYSYSATSGVTLSASSGDSVKVTGKSEGIATVTITAKDSEGETLATKAVSVSVYSDHTVDVSVKSTVTTFDFADTSVFSSVKYDGAEITSSYSLKDTMAEGNPGYLYLQLRSSTTSTTVGTLKKNTTTVGTSSVSVAWGAISNFNFTLNGKSGTQYIDYEIYDPTDTMRVATGTIAITTGGSSGDIIYETDYSSAVTFDEDDFEDFWNDAYPTSSNTLKYVVFGVTSNIPAYGELYTTTAKSKTVTSSLKFQPNYTSSSSYYDLDTVTYVPDSTKKTEYSVEIPFTAYGGAGSSYATSLSGVVVIDLNTGSTGIYSTGVIFGKGTSSIADQMVEDYNEATGKDLAYVVFDLPDVSDGRLYYDYTSILDTDYVDKDDEFYVKPGKNDLALDDVAFVPAAGCSGKVTITYTGYDANGKNAKELKLVLNVVLRTASSYFSDVTSSSYSWAADSIDFLYYQEVVQGSGKKYNPASSITRGDFMIMLYRAFLEGEYGDYNVTSNFADVKKGTTSYSQETYQAIGVAKYLGIAQGDGTNFKPTTSITREEAMTLIYRTLEKVDLELEYTTRTSTSSFTDYSSVASYAKTSISYLIQHGIVIGSNNKINPKSNITRAEMAVILHRVLTY